MADLRPSDIDDLILATLPEYDRMKFGQIAQVYQDYEVMGRIMQKEKRSVEGGDQIDRFLLTDLTGNAKNVGLFEEDGVNVGKHMNTITVPWRFSQTAWGYDVKERQLNRGKPQLFDEIVAREKGAYIDLANLMEDDFWGRLAATADTKKIFGIDYWVNKNSATAGFNGTDPTGFTGGAGGLTVASVPTWANYSAEYTNVTKPDLIQSWRVASRKTNYKSPVQISDYRRGGRSRYSYYCNIDTITELENVGESQNDNLGRDIASMDGQILFHGNPVKWIAALDSDAKDPLYGVDWSCFECAIQSGSYMRRKIVESSLAHDMRSVFIDLTWNTLCTDRRAQFVIEKA